MSLLSRDGSIRSVAHPRNGHTWTALRIALARLCTVTIFSLAFGTTAFSQQTASVPADGESCRAWMQEQKSENARWQIKTAWVEGYIQGVFQGAKLSSDPLLESRMQRGQWLTWLADYCANQPDKKLSEAASALIVQVLKEKERR